MHVQQHLFTHAHIYIYIPGTPYDPFFAVIWPNTAEFGEITIFFGRMPIFGGIWRQVACLKNIDKYWKHIEKLQDWTILNKNWKTCWKHIGNIFGKILVSWLPPHACNLEFEILAYMPYDQKYGHMRIDQKIQSFGGPGIYIHII